MYEAYYDAYVFPLFLVWIPPSNQNHFNSITYHLILTLLNFGFHGPVNVYHGTSVVTATVTCSLHIYNK